jgi:ketosteroid isomerase-like protein
MAAENPIEEAKAVVERHEVLVREENLDGIVANAADDVVVLAPDVPLVEGKAAFREFYSGLLAMGKWDFGHDYAGAEVVGNMVVAHGLARGTLTPADGDVSSFANNFLLTFRKEADGKYRFWRVAFASSGADT